MTGLNKSMVDLAADVMPGLDWVDLNGAGVDPSTNDGSQFVAATLDLGAFIGTVNATWRYGEWLLELVIQASADNGHVSFARTTATGASLEAAFRGLWNLTESIGNFGESVFRSGPGGDAAWENLLAVKADLEAAVAELKGASARQPE
jgi:hypothetical protein